MRRTLALSVMFLYAALADCAETLPSARVSVIQLVATPERYDGAVVFVTGFLTIEFENNSLCATPTVASSKDCLWVQYDDGPWETEMDMQRYNAAKAKWTAMSGKRVSIRATFSKDNTGHMGGSSGGLEKIVDVYQGK